MSPRLLSFLTNLLALAIIAGGFSFLVRLSGSEAPHPVAQETPVVTTDTQTASAGVTTEIPLPTTLTPTTTAVTPKKVPATTTVKATSKAPAERPATPKQPDNQALRVQNPYPYAPVPFESIDAISRPAIVNILCRPRSGGTLSPVSGSGVIIDPRGIILTNAHVAQYVLLSQSARINLSCTIRTGAPAISRWSAEILYIPPVWVETHAHEVSMERPTGTGEHDYALLRITGTVDGTPLPSPFPYLPPDTREAIGFKDDKVLAVSYPAEFIGAGAHFTMYPAASVTIIGQLMTFVAKTVDVLSLGGIIEAQGGSSGGAVVNAWGYLIATLATTSEGDTTATRDLRAITLSYINRDLVAQTRYDLKTILGGDVAAQAHDFNTQIAPRLIDLYIAEISK